MDKDSIIVIAILIVAVFAVFPSVQTQTIVPFEAEDVVVVDNTGDFDSRITDISLDSDGDVVGDFDADTYVGIGNVDLSGSWSMAGTFVLDEIIDSSVTDNLVLFSFGAGKGNVDFMGTTGKLYFHNIPTSDANVEFGGKNSWAIGEEHTFASIYNGSYQWLYLDGVLVQQQANSGDFGVCDIELGITPVSNFLTVDSKMSDICIWKRAISSTEAIAYSDGVIATSALEAHWLDGSDVYGNVVSDVSGNNVDGILTGDSTAFWVSSSDGLPVDVSDVGITVDGTHVYYAGILDHEVTYDEGIASSGTFVGEMPLINAGTSATVTVDRCVEGQFEYVPKFAEIVYVDNVSAGDIGMSAYLVDADGTRLEQPSQVKVSVSDVNHVLYQSVSDTSGFLIPAVDAGEYNVDVQFNSWEFGGWSNAKTFSLHVLEDGGIVVNDAGTSGNDLSSVSGVFGTAQNTVIGLFESVMNFVTGLFSSLKGVGN